MDDVVHLPAVDQGFCARLEAALPGVEFEISATAGTPTGARWAVETSYGETFRAMLFDGHEREAFAPPEMIEAARRLTGLDEVVAFRAQANVMLPGQGLGRHTDVPEFRRARRWSFPDWLLVAMLHSGLYDDDQVRVISALVWPTTTNGGDLRVFDRSNTSLLAAFPPVPGSAVVCDTCRLPHEVSAIPGEGVTVGAGDRIGLRPDGWHLQRTDGSTMTLPASHVRTSVLVKLACFRDEDERDRYVAAAEDMLDQDDVIAALAERLPPGARKDDEGLPQQLVDCFVSYM